MIPLIAPRTVAGSSRSRTAARKLEPYTFVLPTILLLTVLMLIPIAMVISYSFLDNVILNKNPEVVGFANYIEVLSNSTFAIAFKNTILFVIISVIAHLLIGLAFAMLLNTQLLGRWSKALFRVIYVLPWLFTVAIIAVLWRMLLSPNGIVNYILSSVGLADTQTEWLSSPALALAAVTFINIWAGYPFFMISLLAGLQGVPADLYEAATVDGANGPQKFRHITLPQLRPIIISMSLLDLIWTSQQFALIWLTTGGGPINVTEMLSTFTYKLAFSRYEFALASTSAVIILVFSMVLAFFYVRHQRARD